MQSFVLPRMNSMKRTLQYLILLSPIIFTFSCRDGEEPQPVPIVDFFVDPAIVEVGIPAMFDNLSRNADRYEWDFGGVLESEEISPTVTFQNAGLITVTLRAFSQDGKVDSVSKEIKVHERILTGYFVNIFPEMNGEVNWDPDTLANDSIYADILVQLSALDLDPIGLFHGVFVDQHGPFSAPVNPLVDGEIVLTDEDWGLTLFDFDGEVGVDDVTQDNTVAMIGVAFNPVQGATIKNEDGDAGYVSVFFIDSNNNIIDVDLFFELE